MVVFENKSQCSATPSMILNMKNITRCGKFIPKLVPYYLVYCTYLCKQTGAASCVWIISRYQQKILPIMTVIDQDFGCYGSDDDCCS